MKVKKMHSWISKKGRLFLKSIEALTRVTAKVIKAHKIYMLGCLDGGWEG